jgi:hypothetical protein
MPAADPPIRDDTHRPALGMTVRRPSHVHFHKAIVSTLSLADATTPRRAPVSLGSSCGTSGSACACTGGDGLVRAPDANPITRDFATLFQAQELSSIRHSPTFRSD